MNLSPLPTMLALAVALTLGGCNSESKEAKPLVPLKPNVSAGTKPVSTDTPAASQNVASQPPRTSAEPGSGSAAEPSPELQPPGNTAASPSPRTKPPASGGNNGPLADAIPVYETPLWEPSVVLSQAHADTCKLAVGDAFPVLELQTLNGEAVSTEQLLGKSAAAKNRLTVVVLWKADDLLARDEFTRLGTELITPFAPAGVQLVAIHVGGTAEQVEQVAPQPNGAFENLIDPTEAAFGKLATEHLPRTYLLDSQGKVLWFDLEYSAGSRRDLRNALLYYLTEQVEAAPAADTL